MLEELKKQVCDANRSLVDHGLVKLTWGNVSAIDRTAGLVVIKPSGISFAEMKPEDMVVVDMDGQVVEGTLNPSSDTPTHLVLYRKFQKIGSIVHTHSTFATGWAQAGRDIPNIGTTHADSFYDDIPCTRDLRRNEVFGDYEMETGRVIVERFRSLDPIATPGVLVRNHGPFTWGETVSEAIENAIVLEEVAKIAFVSSTIHLTSLDVINHVPSMNRNLIEKHYNRKHGPGAYYGQKKHQ